MFLVSITQTLSKPYMTAAYSKEKWRTLLKMFITSRILELYGGIQAMSEFNVSYFNPHTLIFIWCQHKSVAGEKRLHKAISGYVHIY